MTREEIAKELAGHLTVPMRVLDAVRALPVIATCGKCGWCAEPWGTATWCKRDSRHRGVNPGDTPPSWCPLRGKR